MDEAETIIYGGIPKEKYRIFIPSASAPFPEFTEALVLLEVQPYTTEFPVQYPLAGSILSEIAREFSLPVYYSDPSRGFITSKTLEALNNWLESFHLFAQILPNRRPVVFLIDFTGGRGGIRMVAGKSIVAIVEEGRTPADYTPEEEPEFIEIDFDDRPGIAKIRRAFLPDIPGEIDLGWFFIDHTFEAVDKVEGLSDVLWEIFNAEYTALAENGVALGILPGNASATPTTVGYLIEDGKVIVEKYFIPRGDRPVIFFNNPGADIVEAPATPHELIVKASKEALKGLNRPAETRVAGTIYERVKQTPLEILAGENKGKKADAWYHLLNEPRTPWRYLALFSQDGSLIFVPDLPPGMAVYIRGGENEAELVDIRQDPVAFSTPYTVLGVYSEAFQRCSISGKKEIEKKGVEFALPPKHGRTERLEKYLNTLFFGSPDQYIEAMRIPGITMPFTKQEFLDMFPIFSPANYIAMEMVKRNSSFITKLGSIRKAAEEFVQMARYRPEGKDYYLLRIRGAIHLIKEFVFIASVYSKKFLELSQVFYRVVDAKSSGKKELFYYEIPYSIPGFKAVGGEFDTSGAMWTLFATGSTFSIVEFRKDGARVAVYPKALPLWLASKRDSEERSKAFLYGLPYNLGNRKKFWEEVYRAVKKHPEIIGFSIEVVYVTPVTLAELH